MLDLPVRDAPLYPRIPASCLLKIAAHARAGLRRQSTASAVPRNGVYLAEPRHRSNARNVWIPRSTSRYWRIDHMKRVVTTASGLVLAFAVSVAAQSGSTSGTQGT